LKENVNSLYVTNTTPLPHLVYVVLWICKWSPPPLTHTSSPVDVIGHKVCEVRNTSYFKPRFCDCLWFSAGL